MIRLDNIGPLLVGLVVMGAGLGLPAFVVHSFSVPRVGPPTAAGNHTDEHGLTRTHMDAAAYIPRAASASNDVLHFAYTTRRQGLFS